MTSKRDRLTRAIAAGLALLLATGCKERAVALAPTNPAAIQFHGQLARDAYGLEAVALWFARVHELQPMSIAATAALIAALPPGETEARAELEQKLRSLVAR